MGDSDIEAAGGNGLLTPDETRKIHLELQRAAIKGDWSIANDIYEKYPIEINYRDEITPMRETALHVATAFGNVHFVQQLVERMSVEDLALKDAAESTAFFVATVTGKVELAKPMINRMNALAMIRGILGALPIVIAAIKGHRKMVRLLYDITKNNLEYNDKRDIFLTLIRYEMYDFAMEMLRADKELATDRDSLYGETALHALAGKSSMRANITHQKLPGFWNKIFFHFSSKQAFERTHMHEAARELVQFTWDEVLLQTDEVISTLIGSPWPLTVNAVVKGNIEFLTILIRSYPNLVYKVDHNYFSIFHTAILCRREDIFKWIHEIGATTTFITLYRDPEGNNMLHLAAKLPITLNRLEVVPGAALQLQRELLWFEEVKTVIDPRQLEERNLAGLTPTVMFMTEHEQLLKEGTKWLRQTANSCMVVATLIATVVFAAGFTIPGGNDQSSGIPIFFGKIGFKIYALSSALSLISSLSSVLTFLSIVTSRYALDDFLWSLPNKLMIGHGTLFLSIAAMLVTFIAALFLILNHGHRLKWFAIPIAVIASMPVILFAQQHYRLFMDVKNSTYKSIFDSNKSPLFPKRDRKMISSKEE